MTDIERSLLIKEKFGEIHAYEWMIGQAKKRIQFLSDEIAQLCNNVSIVIAEDESKR